ncbi:MULTISPECIES: zinc ribbon domain-containing protein [Nonomuraea]|uniref:helix-turn-helix domain-containing protein n=1 Tax=Nonomuraea sp. NPDC049504 TaxID=3154729 RepID=UPI002FEAAF04
MKRAYKYRFHPTLEQAGELARTFGCVRLVYNKALEGGMPEYKAAWYGRTVVAVDRWFPSSKLCSQCGTLQKKMPLNVREWTCACGTVHDRDVNAARNVFAAGLAESIDEGEDVNLTTRTVQVSASGTSAAFQPRPATCRRARRRRRPR